MVSCENKNAKWEAMTHGYDERLYGSLESWQTRNKARLENQKVQRYLGYDTLDYWHPYEMLPMLPLEQRRASFVHRLEAAKEKHSFKRGQ